MNELYFYDAKYANRRTERFQRTMQLREGSRARAAKILRRSAEDDRLR